MTLSHLYWLIYVQPLEVIIKALAAAVILWTLFACLLRKTRLWRWINIPLCAAAVAGILYTTLVSRSVGDYSPRLIPFYSFYAAREQVEYYRSMLMNTALFVPLGMTLPFCLRNDKPICRALLYALICSLTIEALQFILRLGTLETDDVLCNELGAVIGTVPALLSRWRKER